MLTFEQADRMIDKNKFMMVSIGQFKEISAGLTHMASMIDLLVTNKTSRKLLIEYTKIQKEAIDSKVFLAEQVCNGVVKDIEGMIAGNEKKINQEKIDKKSQRRVRQ